MKKRNRSLSILLLSFILAGCQPDQANLADRQQQVQPESGSKEFIEPEPGEWVKYIKIVREYMHYRTKAVVNRDVEILWERYPDLKTNIDPKTGQNSEKEKVDSLRGFTLIDANFSEESRERIKVKTVSETKAIVLVHGGVGYVKSDFEEAGGELLIKLFLERKGNQWTVVKTDEYTEAEYKEWMKKK